MRSGVAISAVIHATALFISYAGVPDWLRDEPEFIETPVIVELVTIAEETRAARPKAEQVEQKKPPPSPKAKPEPPPQVVAPPALPEPEPEVAVVVPEAKPKEPEKNPVAKPKRKPKPPRRVAKADSKAAEKPKKYKFDADRIAALVDKTPREQTAQEPPDIERPRPKITARTAQPLDGRPLTMSEVDALRAQIERCWIVQAGARYAEDLIVKIRVYLNPDGSLRREPQIVDDARLGTDPFFRAAAESALRAVLKCEPFKMPVAKYERWREIELTFDPREMLG